MRRSSTSPPQKPETPSFKTLHNLLQRLSLSRYKLTQHKKEKYKINKKSLHLSYLLQSKPPALRVFLLGARGSGKTSNGEWLAQQLGLFHIQFREQLQTLIMAKTKKRVPYADEVDSSKESLEDLEALIREARVGDGDKGTEDTFQNMNDMEVSLNKLSL